MPAPTLTMLEGQSKIVIGGLGLVLAATTAPRASIGVYKTVEGLRFLALIRQLLRIDLSAIDPAPGDFPGTEQLSMSFLKGVLTYYREMAAMLDRLLQINDPLKRKRIRKLVGTHDEIVSVLEALEDKIEDLEIATSPEVHAAIERLIDEAKAP